MKSFTVTIILFVLMLGAIVANAFYIGHVAADLDAMLDRLPDVGDPASAEQANAIRDYWEKQTPTVGLSVSYTVVDRISEQSATLAACAACGDLYGYRTALALLRDAVGDLRRLERFSIENLM